MKTAKDFWNTKFRVSLFWVSLALSGCQSASTAGGVRSETAIPEASITQSRAREVDGGSRSNIGFGQPTTSEPVQVLENVGYTVGYSASKRVPLWASYRLFRVGDAPAPVREDLFEKDPRVSNPVLKNAYEGSGYDRGHLAPSAPLGKRYGKAAQDKTFLMTNMMPQLPGLNQRGWEALENVISSVWAEEFEELWVVSGPIFSGPCKELYSDVAVPSACYMVIAYRDDLDRVKALGVIMPQRRINQEPLRLFVRPIDEIERLTGIDFLRDVPDSVENSIEALGADLADTSWNISQILKPRFSGDPRLIRIRDCN